MSSADPRLPRLGLVRERAEDARHLAAALAELGAVPLLECSGTELSADAVLDLGIEVLVVGLGTEVESGLLDTLDRVRVVFDDLEATAGLTGWDRARWLRHLRAKLVGEVESGPPRPVGAESIQGHPRAVGNAGADRAGPPAEAAIGLAETPARTDAPQAGEAAALAQGTGFDWVQTESPPGTAEAVVVNEAPLGFPGAPSPVMADDFGANALDEPPSEPGSDWLTQAVEAPDQPASLAIDVDETVEIVATVGDALAQDSSTQVGVEERDAGRGSEVEGIAGLDELLDALRREDAELATNGQAAPGDPPTVAVSDPTSESAQVPASTGPAFDFSGLALEPLEGERPVTGRATFMIDETSRPPIHTHAPATAKPAVSAPGAVRTTGSAARTAWLLAAGEADPARVTQFIEALPRTLDTLFLLVRPTTAPWLGATLAVEDGSSLPLVLADEVMESTGGRIVVLSPGERAGFSRSGQLTVQPGDHSLPEALGDWMTMRALAARFGRDAGVIVFGRLRDEVLEGAIELARAGGQVWFESSVFDEPNAVVEAARAAGIAMRTGSGTELAGALAARLGV